MGLKKTVGSGCLVISRVRTDHAAPDGGRVAAIPTVPPSSPSAMGRWTRPPRRSKGWRSPGLSWIPRSLFRAWVRSIGHWRQRRCPEP